jgi:hypothetical protein
MYRTKFVASNLAMKIMVFWVSTPSEEAPRFGGIYRLDFQS